LKQLELSDAQVQELVAPALLKRLRDAGFHTGVPTDTATTVYVPINLDLVGDVEIVRYEDGTWVFRQQTTEVAGMLEHAAAAFLDACVHSDRPVGS
jgi:hypothetical protein